MQELARSVVLQESSFVADTLGAGGAGREVIWVGQAAKLGEDGIGNGCQSLDPCNRRDELVYKTRVSRLAFPLNAKRSMISAYITSVEARAILPRSLQQISSGNIT